MVSMSLSACIKYSYIYTCKYVMCATVHIYLSIYYLCMYCIYQHKNSLQCTLHLSVNYACPGPQLQLYFDQAKWPKVMNNDLFQGKYQFFLPHCKLDFFEGYKFSPRQLPRLPQMQLRHCCLIGFSLCHRCNFYKKTCFFSHQIFNKRRHILYQGTTGQAFSTRCQSQYLDAGSWYEPKKPFLPVI